MQKNPLTHGVVRVSESTFLNFSMLLVLAILKRFKVIPYKVNRTLEEEEGDCRFKVIGDTRNFELRTEQVLIEVFLLKINLSLPKKDHINQDEPQQSTLILDNDPRIAYFYSLIAIL